MEQTKLHIVFLVSGPLTDRWLNYYCLDGLAQCCHIEFWNCAGICVEAIGANEIYRDFVKTIDTYSKLRTNLKRIPKDALIVSEHGACRGNYELLHIVRQYFRQIIIIDIWSYDALSILNLSANHVQGEPPKFSLLVQLKKLLNLYIPFNVIRSFVKGKSMLEIQHRLKTYFSNLSELRNLRIEKKCYGQFKKVYTMSYAKGSRYHVNLPDYETCLLLEHSQPIRNDDYIVYIDQYFPLHPDIIAMSPSIDCPSFADEFYNSMNKFFERVELQYSCKVVIAAHPSSNYQKQNPFNGRDIYLYQTANLIKNCKAVLMHYSNSTFFVAYYNKPVAIINNNAIKSIPVFSIGTNNNARALGTKVVDTDLLECDSIFKPIHQGIRQSYLDATADISCKERNVELYEHNFIEIYNEIHKRNALKVNIDHE